MGCTQSSGEAEPSERNQDDDVIPAKKKGKKQVKILLLGSRVGILSISSSFLNFGCFLRNWPVRENDNRKAA
jgi:hypothetical protein